MLRLIAAKKNNCSKDSTCANMWVTTSTKNMSGLHVDWNDVYIDAELVWPTSPVSDISGPSRQEYMVPTDLYVHTVNAYCEEYDGGRNFSAASAFYNRIISLLNVCDTLK